MRLDPEEFVETYLRGIGAEAVAVGRTSGSAASVPGAWRRFARSGSDVLEVEELEGVSSSAIRDAVRDGDLATAASMLGRPFELDGTVVTGDQRGGTLGYPTANIAMDAQLVCPRYGIYAGEALGHRAAVSIGTNPHYGGTERRIEPFLLDFDGDLYGLRLVVELWERLRDEAVFDSEEALIEQIAKDVEATRAAVRPPSRASGRRPTKSGSALVLDVGVALDDARGKPRRLQQVSHVCSGKSPWRCRSWTTRTSPRRARVRSTRSRRRTEFARLGLVRPLEVPERSPVVAVVAPVVGA